MRGRTVNDSRSTWLARTLGAIFVVAGIAKMFAIKRFSSTIAGVVFLQQNVALVLAVLVVGFEVLGGVLLLLGVRRRLTAFLFLFLIGIFIWVLTSAAMQGKEIACNCFGILGIALGNRGELILDFILLNAFVVLAIPRSAGAGFESPGRKRRWRRAVMIVGSLFIGLQISLITSIPFEGRRQRSGDTDALIDAVGRIDSLFASAPASIRGVIVLRYADLNCPVCFDDLMELIDSLNARMNQVTVTHRVVMLVSPENIFPGDSGERVRRWAAANDIRIPVLSIPDTVRTAGRFARSLLLIVNPDKRVLFEEAFPMGKGKRESALSLLCERSM